MKAYQSMPTPPETCPENPHGHSWQTLSHSGQEVAQRCRFCRQERTIPTYVAKQPRKPAQRDVTEEMRRGYVKKASDGRCIPTAKGVTSTAMQQVVGIITVADQEARDFLPAERRLVIEYLNVAVRELRRRSNQKK
jgi:hypothetical protein